MKRCWAFLSIGLLLLAFSGTAFAGVTEISAENLKAKMDGGNIVVINPLSLIEFKNSHIKGSINIPMGQLKNKLPADMGKPLAFYCLGRK